LLSTNPELAEWVSFLDNLNYEVSLRARPKVDVAIPWYCCRLQPEIASALPRLKEVYLFEFVFFSTLRLPLAGSRQ
jgi:hypothetical protein